MLQVADEAGDGLVTGAGVLFVAGFQSAMLIPTSTASAGVGDMDEADAAFDEAAGEEKFASVILGDGIVDAVELLRRLGFAGEIHRFGRGHLHAEGEFEGGDAGFEIRGQWTPVDRDCRPG